MMLINEKLPLTRQEPIIRNNEIHTTDQSRTRQAEQTQNSIAASTRGQHELAINKQRGSDRSYPQRNQTIRKGQSVMYTILNNGTAVIDCDDLQTAIRFVQSLESGLDRLKQHSPYTIVKASDVPAAAGVADAYVGKSELYARQ